MGLLHNIRAAIWQWRLRNKIFPPQEIGKGIDTEAMLEPKGVRITTGRKILDTKLGDKILFKPNRKSRRI